MDTKTRQEIEDLKADWAGDPSWDLEGTEGFEAHEQELKEFSDMMQARWQAEAARRKEAENTRLSERALGLGCSVETVRHIEVLERQIKELQDKVFNGL